jgi:hypothetical protein
VRCTTNCSSSNSIKPAPWRLAAELRGGGGSGSGSGVYPKPKAPPEHPATRGARRGPPVSCERSRCPVAHLHFLLPLAGLQRRRSQNLTSASGDAIWGAHRPNCIHGQFAWRFFFGPPAPRFRPAPPVHPRGNFHQTDFPPLSCSVLRVPAPLRPHPSGAPAGAGSRGVLPGPGDLTG